MPVKENSMLKITLSFPPDQIARMHALVECGDYPADAEVYRDAVREFLERRRISALVAGGHECSTEA